MTIRHALHAGALLACAVVLWCTVASARAKHRNPDSFDFLPDGEWGEWSGVMTGRIINEDGDPIPFAEVRVHSKDINVRCDRNGFFSIRGLQRGGHYSLLVNGKGYDDAVLRWIPIQSYETTDIGDFHLKPELVTTNFFVVTSNMTAKGEWTMTSNVCEIAGVVTSVYAYTTWGAQQYIEGGRAEFAAYATNMPMIEERPAATNLPQNIPPHTGGRNAGDTHH